MLPRATVTGLCLFATAAYAPLWGQTHKVAAPEKVTRALAVYEWTGELEKPTAARLVPISLFIDSHFEDAGVYLANPIPMALDTGDVYSIERAGEYIGTLDLDYARDIVTRHAASDETPIGGWYGYGRFLSPAEEAKIEKPKASGKLPVVVATTDSDSGDDRPKFIRRESSDPSASAPTKSGSSTKASTSASSTPDPDDDERPTLRHRDPTDDSKKKKGGKPTGYVSGPSTSLNDDPDRPTIRRGLPAGVSTPTQLSGVPAGMHQSVAVSDAANRDAHLFNREWASSTERAETLAALEALAKPLIAAYLTANKLATTAPASPMLKPELAHVATHAAHSVLKKPVIPVFALTNERLFGYTLTYGGLATFVYTVDVPLADGGPAYLTLVAQRLPSSEMQVSLTAVTDARHLDRSPWMRPIDVVDPDWSHRGSLLFELRAQTSRQFALYRLISAKAEQTFITGVIE